MKILKIEKRTKKVVRTPLGIEVYRDHVEIQRCDEGQLHEVVLEENHRDIFVPVITTLHDTCTITLSSETLDDIINIMNAEIANKPYHTEDN